jgi:hypothetical protein
MPGFLNRPCLPSTISPTLRAAICGALGKGRSRLNA